MFKKILFTIFTFVFLIGCEYKPIYSSLNKTNFKIIVTESTGDKKINKFITDNLRKKNKRNTNQIINIKINTKYSKSIIAKDATGSITNYESTAVSTFEIEKEQISEKFVVNEKFNFQKMSDKYEEKSYEENIKRNLATSISQKLILKLAITE